MDPLDSIHDDLMEVVLSHLVKASTRETADDLLNFDDGAFTGYDEDLLKFAATSKRNRRLVFDYMERWYEGDELEIFIWKSVTRASPNLPPLPGYDPSSNSGSRRLLRFERNTACIFAAASGNLDMLKCLRRQGYRWDVSRTMAEGHMVTARAAAGGHVKTLEWARRRSCPVCWPALMWQAVAGGHINMIEYIISKRNRDNKSMSSDDVAIPAIAVKHGQLRVLEWMWEQPYFLSNTEFRERAIEFACEAACDDVIDRQRFDTFNWLRAAGYRNELTKEQHRQKLAREYIHEHYGRFHTRDAPKTYEDYKDLTAVILEARRKGYLFVLSSSDLYYEVTCMTTARPHSSNVLPNHAPYAGMSYFSKWPNDAGLLWQRYMSPPSKPWNLPTVYSKMTIPGRTKLNFFGNVTEIEWWERGPR